MSDEIKRHPEVHILSKSIKISKFEIFKKYLDKPTDFRLVISKPNALKTRCNKPNALKAYLKFPFNPTFEYSMIFSPNRRYSTPCCLNVDFSKIGCRIGSSSSPTFSSRTGVPN